MCCTSLHAPVRQCSLLRIATMHLHASTSPSDKMQSWRAFDKDRLPRAAETHMDSWVGTTGNTTYRHYRRARIAPLEVTRAIRSGVRTLPAHVAPTCCGFPRFKTDITRVQLLRVHSKTITFLLPTIHRRHQAIKNLRCHRRLTARLRILHACKCTKYTYLE